MKLFIANCSHQQQHFNYRMLESTRSFEQYVPIGQQIHISRTDLSQADVDYIVEQNRKYGWLSVDEAKNKLGDKNIPMVFSVDRPISSADMYRIINHNRGVLTQDGAERRKEAAVNAHHVISQIDPEAANTLSMTIKEDKPGSVEHDGLNETLTIDPKAGGRPQPRGRKGK